MQIALVQRLQTAPAAMEADEGGLSDVNGRMSGGAFSFLLYCDDLTEEGRDDVRLGTFTLVCFREDDLELQ